MKKITTLISFVIFFGYMLFGVITLWGIGAILLALIAAPIILLLTKDLK